MANEVEVTVRAKDQTRSGTDSAEKNVSRLGSSLRRVGETAAGFLSANVVQAGFDAFVNGLRGTITEAREAEVVGKTTTQIIKSTGGAANVSAGQVANLAESLSNKAGVDDEVIQTGANLLLTFKQVRNEAGKGNAVFDRATAAALDLSEAGFGSMESTSKMLGKALNDPLKGLTALGRAGVTFTEQQQKRIEGLVKEGKTLQAQKIILGEVESQVGGVAAANATAGEKASVAWANVQEAIGTRLLPVLNKLAMIFLEEIVPVITNKVLPAVDRFSQWASKNTGVIKALAGVIGGILVVAFAAWAVSAASAAVATIAATWPILAIIAAVAALAVGIFFLVKNWHKIWGKIKEITGKAWSAIKGAIGKGVSAVVGFVKRHWPLLLTIIAGPLGLIIALVVKNWAKIKAFFVAGWRAVSSRTVSGVRSVLNFIGRLSAIPGKVGGFFARMVRAAASRIVSLLSRVRSIPGRVVRALGNLGRLLYNAGRNIISGLINGIYSMFGRIRSAIGSAAQTIRNYLPFSPAKEGPLSGGGNPERSGESIGRMLAGGINKSRGIVRSAADSLAASASVGGGSAGMVGGVGAGRGAAMVLEIRSGGSRFDDLLVEVLRRAVKVRGGNVQIVLGKG